MSAHLANWQTVAPASELVPGQFLEFRLKEKAKEFLPYLLFFVM